MRRAAVMMENPGVVVVERASTPELAERMLALLRAAGIPVSAEPWSPDRRRRSEWAAMPIDGSAIDVRVPEGHARIARQLLAHARRTGALATGGTRAPNRAVGV